MKQKKWTIANGQLSKKEINSTNRKKSDFSIQILFLLPASPFVFEKKIFLVLIGLFW